MSMIMITAFLLIALSKTVFFPKTQWKVISGEVTKSTYCPDEAIAKRPLLYSCVFLFFPSLFQLQLGD